jgi:hypothetical protein
MQWFNIITCLVTRLEFKLAIGLTGLLIFLIAMNYGNTALRVLDYRSGGPGSIPGTTRKKVVGLERGPLSLVSTTEELLYRKVEAPV